MNKARIITILVVAAASIGFFVWLTNSYVLDSQAALARADIVITSSDAVNGTVPVSFIIKPQDESFKISGADLHVEVSNGHIDSWEDCKSLDATESGDIFTTLTSETGKSARHSCVVLRGEDQLPSQIVLTGHVKCSTQDDATLVISDKSQATGPVNGSEYELFHTGPVDIACGGGGGSDESAEIITQFQPDTCSANVGETCNYNLNIKAANTRFRMSGIYVKLSYDKDIVQFGKFQAGSVKGVTVAQAQTTPTGSVSPTPSNTDVTPTITILPPTLSPTIPPSLTPPTGAPTIPDPTITSEPSPTAVPTTIPVPSEGCRLEAVNEGPGTLAFMYLCNSPAGGLPTSFSQPLTFNAVGNGGGSLRIEGIQIVGPDTFGGYMVSRDKATYDIGKGAEDGNVTLDMKLRMQCVVKKPKGAQSMRVRVGLGDGPLNKPVYKDATFTADDKGHWNGTVSFNVPAGSGYKILPKGEKHMQKKVCTSSPTEDYPGAYRCDKGEITLREGVNKLDLSNIILLIGDLPPDEQDGISNAKDQSLIRNLIGKSDEESVRLADVNYDGVVNAVDHSCMIAALSVRWDEE